MFFGGEGNVQGNHFPVFTTQGQHQQGMDSTLPLQLAFVFHVWLDTIDIIGINGLGTNKIDSAQEFVAHHQIRQVRTDIIGENGQDTNDFTHFSIFQFPYLVVQFHHFGRLNVRSFAGGRFIMYNSTELAFKRRRYRNDCTSVTNGNRCIIFYQTIILRFL